MKSETCRFPGIPSCGRKASGTRRDCHEAGACSGGLEQFRSEYQAFPKVSVLRLFYFGVFTGAKVSSSEGHFGLGNLPGVIWHRAWGPGAGLCHTSMTSTARDHWGHREGPWQGGSIIARLYDRVHSKNALKFFYKSFFLFCIMSFCL